MVYVQETVETLLEGPAVGNFQGIQITIGGGVDSYDLLFYW